MPALVAGIHVFLTLTRRRGWPDKPGHDESQIITVCGASVVGTCAASDRNGAYFRQPVIGHSSFAVARFSGHTDL
jgi:hypothetical protein